MLSNQQRNRNVTNDTAVQSVFVMLQHYYPELNRHMQLLEEKRGKRRRAIPNINRLFSFIEAYYENLQDKLNQLKDAREALNALRSEHYERKQQEALERERQRQIQLAQKLDFMRQKKQVRWTKNTSIERTKMNLLGIFGLSTSIKSSTISTTRIGNENSSRTTTSINISTRTICTKSSISNYDLFDISYHFILFSFAAYGSV